MGRHIDVTVEDELYERLTGEVEKRGGTIAGFIRRTLLDALQHRRVSLVDGDGEKTGELAALRQEVAALREGLERLESLVVDGLRALAAAEGITVATVLQQPREEREPTVRRAVEFWEEMRARRSEVARRVMAAGEGEGG
jgi:hypothetical protein